MCARYLVDADTKTVGLHPGVNVFRVKNLSPRPGRVLLNRLVAEVRFLRKLAAKAGLCKFTHSFIAPGFNP
jgi:hypothetical protein